MVEELYAEPGSMCVASDSHSNMYGGVGCLGTPIVRTDAASIWVTGRTWWRVPPVVNVELRGALPAGCSGKDVIIALCGFLNEDQVCGCCIYRNPWVVDRVSVCSGVESCCRVQWGWGGVARCGGPFDSGKYVY